MVLDSDFIKQCARQVGFDACGIARATDLPEDAAYLRQWLDKGSHGTMSYLERNFEKRTNPQALVPGCKSVVVLLLNYYNPSEQHADEPYFAMYSRSAVDYHTVIKSKLKQLEKRLCDEYGDSCVSSLYQHSFVDSAPVLERRWAQRAGLGWLGKHTQLISPNIGSYCFIAILLLNHETAYDEVQRSRCGSCSRCIDACPTAALSGDGLNATRCISYLTIENKQAVPEEFHANLRNCALGCDICASVCPWNAKWAHLHTNNDLMPEVPFYKWKAAAWRDLTKAEFDNKFKASALKRAGLEKIKQNISYLRFVREE